MTPEELQAIIKAAVAEALAQQAQQTAPAANATRQCKPITIAEMVSQYRKFAKEYYTKNGKPTSEFVAMRYALNPLAEKFGSMDANDFGPTELREVQAHFVTLGWSRRVVNKQIQRILRMVKWAVGQPLVESSVLVGLQAVPPLKRGRTKAVDYARIKPVDQKAIEAIRPHTSPVIMAMVDLQRLTGMRPAEVCNLRTCDLSMDGDVWEYRIEEHKTAHHDRERVVLLGPQAQKILAEWMDANDQSAYVFCPRRSAQIRSKMLRESRKTPLWASHMNKPRKGTKVMNDRYSTDTYRRAITRACELAGVAPWHPNQLRHLAATNIRREFGLDVARAVLGHSCVEMTQIYAEQDVEKSRLAMATLG